MNQILMIAIGILSIFLLICLIRAVIGPSIADRIVSVNMMGTIVMVIIAMLAILLHEGYLVDICIIYAMISFLAVATLTKIFLGIYRKRKERGTEND
ncbi:MAG: sodium:proton antiporter [Lachnospiraceae bacterium]|nr:sodium:proton antiporter [Lachnospiraceae bacterium]